MGPPLEARPPARLRARRLPAVVAGALSPPYPGPCPAKRRIAVSVPPRAAAPRLSSVPSLRPPPLRPNHLRSKLIKIHAPPPPKPLLEAPQEPVEETRGRREGGGETSYARVEEEENEELRPSVLPLRDGVPTNNDALILEETKTELLVSQQTGDQRSFFPVRAAVPKLVLQLSMHLVGLLAVQTVCAVWLLGGSGVGKGKNGERLTDVSVAEGEKIEPEMDEGELEFERVVSAIQAMAKEARATEGREALGRDAAEVLKGDIRDEVIERMERLGKRMPEGYIDAKALSSDLVGGDVGKARRTPAKGFSGRKNYASSARNSSSVTLGGSKQMDRDERTKKSLHPLIQKASNASVKQTASSGTSMATGIASEKKSEHNHLPENVEGSRHNTENLPWWLRLQYVMAIFLHRGSDRKEFNGLYTLKLDSALEEGHDSLTVLFEDRVDATNFCYLLETFFEDLDDLFADVIPMSVQEVYNAVKSRTLQAIVVRKGQLQLYAGQPLAEAETQLRSMLD